MADNVFTRKLGPFPGWVWVGAGVGALLIASMVRSKQSTSSSGQTANAIAAQGLMTATGGQGAAYNAGQANGTMAANDSFASFLGGFATAVQAQPQTSTPGNQGTAVVTPGNMGAPQIQNVNPGDYPVLGNAVPSQYAYLGSINNAGKFVGHNVSGGAPVYAYVNGQYQQNFGKLNPGTPLYTLSQFQGNINPNIETNA